MAHCARNYTTCASNLSPIRDSNAAAVAFVRVTKFLIAPSKVDVRCVAYLKMTSIEYDPTSTKDPLHGVTLEQLFNKLIESYVLAGAG